MSQDNKNEDRGRQSGSGIELGPEEAHQLAALGRLAGKAAHDLNNSIAAALMQLALLRRNPQIPANLKESIQSIEAELGRAATLTRQLLLLNPQAIFDKYAPDAPKVVKPVVAVETQPAPLNDESQIRGGSETILLVDDDPNLRRMTALCLRKLGYAVFEAADSPDAIEMWNQRKPSINLLLADMTLPGTMTGLQLAQQFKTESPALPVIISTGYNIEAAEAHPGFKNMVLLQKPYLPPALAAAVRQCLDEGSRPA